MENWLWTIIILLIVIILALFIKIYLLKKAAREIETAFAERFITDTNTLIDISSRDKNMRKLAASINVQLRKLRRERHRFQQGDLELKDAITNISHDLRTPLTAICGYLDLLAAEEKSEAANAYLDVISSRVEVLKQLTEELFRYTVVTSTLTAGEQEEVAINSVLEESISAYYAALKGCQIVPEISLPKQKIMRTLNRSSLSRIFGNVISNAIKYSDGDLQITLTESGEIIFANHASHLNEMEVGRLFDRYYTVEAVGQSTGLGLSIARLLVEQMEGTITASYQNKILSIYIRFSPSYN